LVNGPLRFNSELNPLLKNWALVQAIETYTAVSTKGVGTTIKKKK